MWKIFFLFCFISGLSEMAGLRTPAAVFFAAGIISGFWAFFSALNRPLNHPSSIQRRKKRWLERHPYSERSKCPYK